MENKYRTQQGIQPQVCVTGPYCGDLVLTIYEGRTSVVALPRRSGLDYTLRLRQKPLAQYGGVNAAFVKDFVFLVADTRDMTLLEHITRQHFISEKQLCADATLDEN